MHTYEVRPRKDKRGVDLIGDALPFGRKQACQFAVFSGKLPLWSQK
jgi:hypothetical protein